MNRDQNCLVLGNFQRLFFQRQTLRRIRFQPP
jgi:hypothetical protein